MARSLTEGPGSIEIDTTQAAAYPLFTKEARRTHTVYVPQMAPIHFRMITPVLRRAGYQVEVLETVTPADVEVGLKYVNHDACYPAIMVIGQLVNKFSPAAPTPTTRQSRSPRPAACAAPPTTPECCAAG